MTQTPNKNINETQITQNLTKDVAASLTGKLTAEQERSGLSYSFKAIKQGFGAIETSQNEQEFVAQPSIPQIAEHFLEAHSPMGVDLAALGIEAPSVRNAAILETARQLDLEDAPMPINDVELLDLKTAVARSLGAHIARSMHYGNDHAFTLTEGGTAKNDLGTIAEIETGAVSFMFSPYPYTLNEIEQRTPEGLSFSPGQTVEIANETQLIVANALGLENAPADEALTTEQKDIAQSATISIEETVKALRATEQALEFPEPSQY